MAFPFAMTSADSLRDLFERALDLPDHQRAGFLASCCPDLRMRRQIEQLLAADHDRRDPLATLSAPDLADALGDAPVPGWGSGQCIGGWTLHEHLGDGGSATVFRATRNVEGTLQQAAIKLLHRGLHSPEAQRQFRREREVLAALDHPNIAHLIDGGVTAEGTAYLVITYVDGSPITDHACAAQLGLRERLQMMVVVCRAVAHAQRNLIVHRDLKPANILVSNDGTVKLLDFGIAKLLAAGQALPADATRTGYAQLTPGYAAPEQFEGGTITTATDVYALGVILHELLLGERPDPRRPLRASARVDELVTDLWRLPVARPQLRAALRGDLDTILLKALAEEPARRYAGADQLADDIERHLAMQPIRAHPPSRWYRTRKFVQRHRGGVVATLALLTAILSATAIALWQAAEARHESRRANALRDFMVGAFQQAAPGSPREGAPRITDVVHDAIVQARNDTRLDPSVRGELLMHLGVVLREQGVLDESLEVLGEALAGITRHRGADSQLSLQAELELLRAEVQAHQTTGARARMTQMLPRIAPGDAALRAAVLGQSATVAIRERDLERCMADARSAAELARSLDDPALLAEALGHLAQAHFVSGDFPAAARVLEEQLAARQDELGLQHWRVAAVHANLSRIYRRSGDLDAAEREARSALAIDDAVLGADDWRRGQHLNALLMVHRDRHDYEAALSVALESLRVNTLAQGDDSPLTFNEFSNAGFLSLALERADAAKSWLQRADAGYSGHFGRDYPLAIRARSGIAMAIGLAGDVDTGLAQMQAAIDDYRRIGNDADGLAEACEKFARLALDSARHAAAAGMPDCIDQALASASRVDSWWNGRADMLRAELALHAGDSGSALRHLDAARPAIEHAAADLLQRADWWLLHASALHAGGDSDATRLAFAQAQAALQALPQPPSRLRRRAAALEAIMPAAG
ncbi:hypothetical protein B1808_02550 [Pseudofulvimonas gallinarii]|uniref:non-specific serine/threonine protein kinase n=2 Tax=Pseudofulvimonas gallinarii TaxID=634155 RepID=A0A4S3KZ38_9GAMM|nr:serine/threonine-protein kinase [Pseudofulvimonas gallinarii]THD14669.1 hypothetical protein B1808_02550 [Pseudofulvimonas gallinarii]